MCEYLCICLCDFVIFFFLLYILVPILFQVALQQTSTWVNAKFSTLIKVLAEKQEATELFMEEQQESAIGEAELRLGRLEENCKILRQSQEHIAVVHNFPDTELIKVRHCRSSDFISSVSAGLHCSSVTIRNPWSWKFRVSRMFPRT